MWVQTANYIWQIKGNCWRQTLPLFHLGFHYGLWNCSLFLTRKIYSSIVAFIEKRFSIRLQFKKYWGKLEKSVLAWITNLVGDFCREESVEKYVELRWGFMVECLNSYPYHSICSMTSDICHLATLHDLFSQHQQLSLWLPWVKLKLCNWIC